MIPEREEFVHGLFAPKWQSKNIRKVLKAIKSMDDQNLLHEIALGKGLSYELMPDDKRNARKAAAERITDVVLLMDIYAANTDSNCFARDRMRSMDLNGQDLAGIIRFSKRAWSPYNIMPNTIRMTHSLKRSG